MHTVDLLDQAVGAAKQRGYKVREEWLGGAGGACEIQGQKWLFLDLALSPDEQLEQVLEALRDTEPPRDGKPGRNAA
jgi:hypothetical protein